MKKSHEKSNLVSLYGRIICVNLKHHFVMPFLAAVGIFFLTLLLFNIAALEETDAAGPIEFLLCWTGVALLTPIFLPEQNPEIRDVICARKTDYLKVCGIRLIYSVTAVAALISLFVGMMKICESHVTYRLLAGGIYTALFLGAVGFAAAGISCNTVVGYMAAMIVYLANYGLKGKLGRFSLFAMSMGGNVRKEWLLLGAAVLIILTFAILRARQKY